MYFWGQTVRELLEHESLMSGEHESIRLNLSDKMKYYEKLLLFICKFQKQERNQVHHIFIP